jgi:hypothetical protein
MTSASECTESWRKRVSAYHDGGVLGEERAVVETHLRDCQPCQALLGSYDTLYRELRTMPGFEGVLTITKPGSRRGVGATAKPSLTWPGRSLTDLNSTNGHRPRSGSGGSIIVTLLILLGLAFLVGREANVLGPNAVLPQATSASLPIVPPKPTLAAFTPGGTACADRGTTISHIYSYNDAQGNIYQITGCLDPVKLATLPFTDYDLGAWKPDASGLLVFSPALAHRTPQTQTHLSVLAANGNLHAVNLTIGSTTYSADDAVWASTTTLIVRSQTKLLLADLSKPGASLLPMTATQIAWRANALYYSTVQKGHASLHRYVLTTKTDTTLLDLGAGQTACPTYTCWTNAPWDVSADGQWVAYQYPVVTTVPKNVGTSTHAELVLQALHSATRTNVAALPISGALTTIAIAPNNRYVAAMGMDAVQGGTELVLGTADGKAPALFAMHGRIAWRADSAVLIAMPLLPSASTAPALIDVAHGTASPLVPDTTGYSWQI